jgi:hypothetical protein
LQTRRRSIIKTKRNARLFADFRRGEKSCGGRISIASPISPLQVLKELEKGEERIDAIDNSRRLHAVRHRQTHLENFRKRADGRESDFEFNGRHEHNQRHFADREETSKAICILRLTAFRATPNPKK